MDKEAQETIEQELDAIFQQLLLHPMNLPRIKKIGVESILGAVRELGYRKLEDKPPLLSDEEIADASYEKSKIFTGRIIKPNSHECVAEAQRDSDWRWFKRGDDVLST